MARQGDGSGSMRAETSVHQSGMKTRMPSATDASTKPQGGSVNDDTTRKSAAPTPASLGGRCA